MHAIETVGLAKHYGQTKALDGLDLAMPEGSILAHGVHATRDDVCLAAERGLWFVHNPRSNDANGVGYPRALDATRRVALGTDGFAADMTAEVEAGLGAATRNGGDPDRIGPRLDAGEELLGADLATIEVDLAPGELRVGGRTVATAGRLVTGDVEALAHTAQEQATRLWRRMEELA